MLHSDMAHCTSASYSKSFLFYYVFLVVQDIYSLAQRSQVGCGGLLLDHSAAQVVDVAFAARWGCSDAVDACRASLDTLQGDDPGCLCIARGECQRACG